MYESFSESDLAEDDLSDYSGSEKFSEKTLGKLVKGSLSIYSIRSSLQQ